MNRWVSVIVASLTIGLCGCSRQEPKKSAPIPVGKTEKSDDDITKRDEELKKAVNDGLDPKPMTMTLSTLASDTEPGNPIDVVHLELNYSDDVSLGYKSLKIASVHFIGKVPATRTIIMATFKDGDKELKIIHLRFDPAGTTTDRMTFEEDKGKLAAVEKRCMEVKKVIDKKLPTEHVLGKRKAVDSCRALETYLPVRLTERIAHARSEVSRCSRIIRAFVRLGLTPWPSWTKHCTNAGEAPGRFHGSVGG